MANSPNSESIIQTQKIGCYSVKTTQEGNLRIKEDISWLSKIVGSIVTMVLPAVIASVIITINQFTWTADRIVLLISPVILITLSLIQNNFRNLTIVEITPQGKLLSSKPLKTPPSSIKRIEVFKRRANFDVMVYTDDFNTEVARYLQLEDANQLRNTIDQFINPNQGSS
ncbi:hypothetical protein C0431_10435 [bacterium]|nr:hypothetical protein [bacterium]